MTAYYNENDPEAAAWLRELIADGAIPPGDVDERSIEDVRPDELAGYAQCHFFAGIGGWPLALRIAGWPDDRPVWTGSCPCQPFSAAGNRGGTDDPRHLWPAWRWLIDQCRPATLFGEQVASKAGRAWCAGVQTDLQAMGYSTAAFDLGAASVGAPHIRQRLWWVGHAQQQGLEGYPGHGDQRGEPGRVDADAGGSVAQAGGDCRVANTDDRKREGEPDGEGCQHDRQATGRQQSDGFITASSGGGGDRDPWAGAVWIDCADGKARRIEPGLEPLVDGLPRGVVPSSDPGAPGYAENTAEARKMRLAGYGNAIVPQVAAEVVGALMTVIEGP